MEKFLFFGGLQIYYVRAWWPHELLPTCTFGIKIVHILAKKREWIGPEKILCSIWNNFSDKIVSIHLSKVICQHSSFGMKYEQNYSCSFLLIVYDRSKNKIKLLQLKFCEIIWYSVFNKSNSHFQKSSLYHSRFCDNFFLEHISIRVTHSQNYFQTDNSGNYHFQSNPSRNSFYKTFLVRLKSWWVILS